MKVVIRKTLAFLLCLVMLIGCTAAYAVVSDEKTNSIAGKPYGYEIGEGGDWEATRDEWFAGIEARAQKYAPKVRTLDNGVQIQRTPADQKAFNNKYYNSDQRGCGACHTDLADDLMCMEDFNQEGNGGWSHYDMRNDMGIDMTWRQCLSCHLESSYTHEFSTVIHVHHEGNKVFEAMGGNCWSCHFVDEDLHELVFWDEVKYDVLDGINEVANVQGEFSYEQDKLQTRNISTNSMYDPLGNDGTRIFKHFSGLKPDPENDGVYDAFTISITGDVENPCTFTMRELIENAPSETHIGTHHCEINGFGGPMISSREMTGIPLTWLLEQACPKEGATGIMYGWTERSFEYLERFPAYIAYEFEGEPLTYEEGYPNVLWIMDGFAGVMNKATMEIEVVSSEISEPDVPGCTKFDGNYDNTPSVGICQLKEGQILPANEPHTFEGYAHAYQLGIANVEISMDGGETWTTFDTAESTDGKWVYWYFTWQPEETGAYVISVRTTSKEGSMVSHANELLFNVQ